jgi:hypothetical protein
MFPFIRHLIIGINSLNRAFGYTCITVNALIRIYDQKIRPFSKSVNRANCRAVGVFTFNTWFCNNVRHGVKIE